MRHAVAVAPLELSVAKRNDRWAPFARCEAGAHLGDVLRVAVEGVGCWKSAGHEVMAGIGRASRLKCQGKCRAEAPCASTPTLTD
jgi:hypothetical protein